jgi:succinyl-CoA synthetase beta subunit
MVEDTKGFRILQGFRNQPAVDLETLKTCLVGVSRILVEHPEVQNLDINPMLVFDEGQGCLVVDVKIQVDRMTAASAWMPAFPAHATKEEQKEGPA